MDSLNRPNWDTYFISLAFLSSTRSLDPSTKHGCVITDKSHRVLSIGYNGPPRNMKDHLVPLTRPEKYAFMAHAEENAILNCNTSTEGAIAYVTGHPCHKCFRMLIQKGISKIVYGCVGSNCVDMEDLKSTRAMRGAMICPVTMVRFKENPKDVLRQAIQYYDDKCSRSTGHNVVPGKKMRRNKKAGVKGKA